MTDRIEHIVYAGLSTGALERRIEALERRVEELEQRTVRRVRLDGSYTSCNLNRMATKND